LFTTSSLRPIRLIVFNWRSQAGVVSRDFRCCLHRLPPSGAAVPGALRSVSRIAYPTVRSPNHFVQSGYLDHHPNGVVSVNRRGIVRRTWASGAESRNGQSILGQEQASMTRAPPQRMHAQSLAAFGCGVTLGGRLFCCFPGRNGGARNPRFPFYRDIAPAAELASRHVSTRRRRRAQGMYGGRRARPLHWKGHAGAPASKMGLCSARGPSNTPAKLEPQNSFASPHRCSGSDIGACRRVSR
jgi:hypothetical protein